MASNFQKKKETVHKMNEMAKTAVSAVVINFFGISVNEINKLRKASREAGVYLYVVRNTLLYRAVKNTVFECLKDIFVGPTLIAYSTEHPGAAARLLKDFSKINKEFEIKAAAFKGKLISKSQIESLANLPTYKEAITRLIITMIEASFMRLIRMLVFIRDVKGNNG